MFGKLPLSTFVITKVAVNSVAAGKAIFRVPFACKIKAMSIAVDATSVGSSQIFDVNKNGTTLFTTQANRPAIAVGAFSAVGGAAAANTFTAGQVVTVDIDAVGSTEAGRNVSVTLAVDFAPTAALLNA